MFQLTVNQGLGILFFCCAVFALMIWKYNKDKGIDWGDLDE